jgi:hypothetical protein
MTTYTVSAPFGVGDTVYWVDTAAEAVRQSKVFCLEFYTHHAGMEPPFFVRYGVQTVNNTLGEARFRLTTVDARYVFAAPADAFARLKEFLDEDF